MCSHSLELLNSHAILSMNVRFIKIILHGRSCALQAVSRFRRIIHHDSNGILFKSEFHSYFVKKLHLQRKMLWDTLPDDLQNLILHHRAAMCIQRRWRPRRMFRHARNPVWPRVRHHIGDLWAMLVRYSEVRREWRQEPHSWLYTPRTVLLEICDEALRGMWGSDTNATPLLSVPTQGRTQTHDDYK